MPAKNVSDQTGVTDFKKLYSSHIQENKNLQRRKSFIDDEKVRTFKSLSFEESVFLKKYDKYTRTYSGTRRRQSIDANILRAADSNAQRDHCVSRQSLARDFVQNDFPYSFDTWNKLVDADNDIIECHKGEILSAEDGDVHPISEVYTEKLQQLSESIRSSTNDWEKFKEERQDKSEKASEIEIVSDANSIEEQITDSTNMLRRRNSLTPIDKSLLSKSTENLTEKEETLDLEELSPRSSVKKKFRRHSVTPVLPTPGLQRRRQSVDIGSIKLPSISENAPKAIRRRKSKSNNDLIGLGTEKMKPVSVESQKVPMVPKVKVNDIDADKLPHELSFSPRPTPNAAVFVCGDSGVSERKDVTNHEQDINVSPRKQENKPEGVLPDINVSQTLIQTPTYDYLDTPPLRDRSQSVSTCDSPVGSAGKTRRRTSMGTTTLNLLVENTKGAARLRYIALLATEMEKEEKQRLNIVSPPPKDPMESVKACRYLRMSNSDTLERADTLL